MEGNLWFSELEFPYHFTIVEDGLTKKKKTNNQSPEREKTLDKRIENGVTIDNALETNNNTLLSSSGLLQKSAECLNLMPSHYLWSYKNASSQFSLQNTPDFRPIENPYAGN